MAAAIRPIWPRPEKARQNEISLGLRGEQTHAERENRLHASPWERAIGARINAVYPGEIYACVKRMSNGYDRHGMSVYQDGMASRGSLGFVHIFHA